MTNSAELERLLLEHLAKRLATEGFENRVRGHSLWKQFPDGRVSLHINFARYPGCIVLSADIGIRFNRVEEMANGQITYLTKKEKANTYTLGAELGNISSGKRMTWEIRGVDDIENVASAIYDAYIRIGKPYAGRFTNMDEAFDMLRRDDPQSWTHAPFHVSRAKSSLALAKILGKDAEVQILCKAKREFLASRDDVDLDEFLEFANSIL